MKKIIFRFLTAIVVCGLAMTLFTQCNRNEEDNTVTDDVRHTQICAESHSPNNDDILFATIKDFVWANGLLKSDLTTLTFPNSTTTTSETHYYYSGNNCIATHTIHSHDNHKYFTCDGDANTYANGRLVVVKGGNMNRCFTYSDGTTGRS